MKRTPKSVEPPLPMPERLWTIRDTADFLGLSVSTLYEWSYKAEGPPVMRIGGRLRYDPNQVIIWARSGVA